MSRPDFGTVICGGGPAGLGPILAAGIAGRLPALLADGVRVVERSDRLGPGALARYVVGSNSLGRAFLEVLEDSDEGYLDPAGNSAAAAELRRRAGAYPPLPAIAAFQDRLGAAVRRRLEDEPGCEVALETDVEEIQLLPGGGAAVSSSSAVRGGGQRERVNARNVVIACGGRPRRDADSLRIAPGVDLGPWREKVVDATALIDREAPIGERLCEGARRRGTVAIVGNSHSAWSAACRILGDCGLQGRIGRPRVCMIERRPTRLAYMSAAEARADGYRFDPARDVCPLSGRVNRFSGLRGEAFELARRALFGAEPPLEGFSSLPASRPEAVNESLSAAGFIVSAAGFEPRLPRLLDAGGEPLRLLDSGPGLAVSDRAELLDASGRPVPSLVAYGLGAGLRPSPHIGGEPSFGGRLDGVWLYQHDLGKVVLDRLLAPAVAAGEAL